MRVGTYPTRNFATLGPLDLRPPLTGASLQSYVHPSGSPSGTGQESARIRPLAGSRKPVFLLNSRSGPDRATPSGTEALGFGSLPGSPFYRRVRGHFAEFLNEGSPVHLGVVLQPTRVGLRYGRRLGMRGAAFLDGVGVPDTSGRLRAPRAAPQAVGRPRKGGGQTDGTCLARRPTRGRAPCPMGAPPGPCRVPASRRRLATAAGHRCRNVRLLSIAYACTASA